MPGVVDFVQRRVPKVPQRVVLADAVRIALAGVHDQHRALDALPQRGHVRVRNVVRPWRARVVVELPRVGAVLVLIAAVGGEMPSLRWGEMWVRFLHPLVGVFQGGVAARHPGSQGVVGVDPQPQPLPRRIHVAWVQANALDDDQPLHQLREGAGEDRRDGAAQRMRDHRQRRQAPLTHQLGDVLHVFQVGVGAAEGPLRIPVAAQIGRHHVEAFAQRLRQPVPGMAMVVNAMHQQQIGRGVVAPIEVVKPQALREVAVRRGIVPIRHRRRTWRLRVGGFYPVGACDSPLVEGMLRRSRSQQTLGYSVQTNTRR